MAESGMFRLFWRAILVFLLIAPLAQADQTVRYKYDPDGNRIGRSSTTAAGTTNRKYIVDVTSDLPVILLELDADNNNAVVRSYVYAHDQVIMQHDGAPAAGNKYFYLHDRLGSVRQVIDVQAIVRGAYSYAPFGRTYDAEDDEDEDLSNPFGFTGQYHDRELGQYHLRARQYDPQTHRFTARDPVRGTFNNPSSLHPYLYCGNDPLNKTDPSGRTTLTDTVAAAGLHTRLYGAAATAVIGGGQGIMNILRRAMTQHYFNLNYVTQAMRRGRSAELAVQRAFRLAQSQVRMVLEGGKTRIFDFVHQATYIEVKNRASVSLTPQLKDMGDLAKEGNLVLIVRQGAHLSKELLEWASANKFDIYEILPIIY